MSKRKIPTKKHVDAIFSLVFKSAFRSEPVAKSFWPLSQREPKMPKEILDLID